MAGFVLLTGPNPNDSNTTVLGSGYYIGDNVILTAGHVIYFFNEAGTIGSREVG